MGGNAASTLLGHHLRAAGGPLLDPSTENHLPMPPPYTSREPSISRHPMSPPPRYTSILGIDSAVEEPRELHVDIPEEQETTATIGSTDDQQPPSYIEEQETTATIGSPDDQQPPSYIEEQETTAAIASNVEQ